MPLNRHDWAAIYVKVAFIAMLMRVLVDCGVADYEILLKKCDLVLGDAASLSAHAEACSTPALTGAYNATVPTKTPDSTLFDSVNFCQWFVGCG